MQYAQIPGQEEIKQRLRKSVAEKRIPHALLFAGPEGCGHLALALAFASHLLCDNPAEDESCGHCRQCKNIRKLTHPDLRFTMPLAVLKKRKPLSSEFTAEWRQAVLANPYLTLNDWYEFLGFENKQGFISIDESADILRAIALKPVEGRYRFVFIWMAEKLRTDAANRLLKSLEEPEGNNIFILLTSQPDALLTTLLSRTQLIKIPPFSVQEIEQVVKNNYALDPLTATRIALLSDGNLSHALSLASKEEVKAESENGFLIWMRLCYSLYQPVKTGKDNFSRLADWVDEFAAAGRENQKSFILSGIEFLRQCILLNYAGEEWVRYSDDIIPSFSKFSRFIHPDNIEEFEKELNDAFYAIERNANPRILFLNLSLKVNRLLYIPA
jgi:DNA polymerase-3 subunit delta'